MDRLKGKVALVTGAGSGIGRGAATALAKEGAAVLVSDLDLRSAEETAGHIVRAGGRVHPIAQDVINEARWDEVVQEAERRFGPLNILVNNAGVAIGGMIAEFSLADWRRQMEINLDSVFLGTRAAIRALTKSGATGSIINISSVAGLRGSAGLSAYCASKGGVRLFTKAAAVECARQGLKVRVNSVHPGIINTPIWDKEINRALQAGGTVEGSIVAGAVTPGANRIDPEIIAQVANVPLGVAGQPADIAAMIVFLASEESRYMTGAELVVDGGMTA